MDNTQYKEGDVFQINETHERAGWIGAFVVATEIKSWGVQGFVPVVVSHKESGQAYTRIPFSQLDYIGHTTLRPA